jgi:SAM-dependent methyltransferase
MNKEIQRILEAYQRIDIRTQTSALFFGYENLAHVYRIHERHRETLLLLKEGGYYPLTKIHILDVGCGDGVMLRQFLQWGAMPENLVGIELRSEPVKKAHYLTPNLDILCGSATDLPYTDASFDLVCQHTVFTSILESGMKQQIASEICRVLRPGGAVLWYDFMYNNPHNPDVRGIKKSEIEFLFPGFVIQLRRITLAPPIARRMPKFGLTVLYPLLASIPFLRTHNLGLLKKPNSIKTHG